MSALEVFMLTIAVGGLFLIIYDIYLLRQHLPTISEETALAAKHAPILAFGFGIVVGVLGGHFFWQMC